MVQEKQAVPRLGGVGDQLVTTLPGNHSDHVSWAQVGVITAQPSVRERDAKVSNLRILGVFAVIEIVAPANDVHVWVLQLGQAQRLEVVNFVDEACREEKPADLDEGAVAVNDSTAIALGFLWPISRSKFLLLMISDLHSVL